MPTPTIAPYGTWASPLGADRVAGGGRPVGGLQAAPDGGVCWQQSLPADDGRVVLLRADAGAPPRRVTGAPFNVRSRVHEYGGGAALALRDAVVFSDFGDNRVYHQPEGGAARALTHDSRQRHADFCADLARGRVIAVCEDHREAALARAGEPQNRLEAIALDGGGTTPLAEGHDFYAAPRLSPDGSRLAWLCWRHPQMPWDGTELWCAGVGADGRLQAPRRLAGGLRESLLQPSWSPDGVLHVVSDRSGWWHPYRVDEGDGTLAPLWPAGLQRAEFARPMWQLGQATYGFDGADAVIAACVEAGAMRLLRIDRRSGQASPIDTPYTEIDTVCVGDGSVVLGAASPTRSAEIARLDLATGGLEVLARSHESLPAREQLSQPQTLAYPSRDGRTAHAHFYPPTNPAFVAPAGEKPPLIVTSHGGPTSRSGASLSLGLQFWTSRGFAVLDVNYGGSSGYGRPYREALNGRWGVVDVEDCVEGARHLAASGRVDPARMAIRGASASGFTTLSALAFHDVFKAGASHYGVADLAALDADTHKFESRYTQTLICAPADRERVYAERSPAYHAQRLNCPMIFFQGLDDRVVPPSQSQRMVDALKARGVPVAYLAFEGEGHGFRRQDSLRRTLEAELWFYGQVFGFTPAGDAAPLRFETP